MTKRILKSTAALRSTLAVLLVLSFLALPQAALAWGTATHVYIAKRLGQQLGLANAQEMYGATLPDFPTLMFGYKYSPYLYTQTHSQFMNLVRLAPLGYQRALAYGFASHNEEWGADFTAHRKALGGGAAGYVNQKLPAVTVPLYLSVVAFLNGANVSNAVQVATALTPVLADTCIESAVDLLVSENEFAGVGVEMMLASGLRASFAPTLLTSAYAKGLADTAGISQSAAAAIISAAEAKNREYLTTYGALLTQANRRDLLAETIAQLAEQLLKDQYSLTVDVPAALIARGLDAAKLSVQSDYSTELAATVKHVGTQLQRHWIFTSLIP